MGDRARVVVSVTASVDGRVTVGRDRLLLSDEARQLWRSLWPEGFASVNDARTALPEELYAPTAILEGTGALPTRLRLMSSSTTADGVVSLRYEVVR